MVRQAVGIMIRCGNCKSRHTTAADVRECYAETATQNAEHDAEIAFERHLEDRGSDEARAQDQFEADRGVISFSDAWDMACPERVAERRAAYVAESNDRLRRMIDTQIRRH